MPLYEYKCDGCGEVFELIQKFSDPPVEVCQKCGKGPVHKLMSSPAIQFKGSGWYITDYAKKDQVSASKSDSGSSDSKATKDSKAAADSGSSTPSTPPANAPAKKD